MSDSDNNRNYFLDCTDADSASIPAIYGLPQYDENINKIGFIPTSTLGHHFVYGRENTNNRYYRDGEPTPIARYGSLILYFQNIYYTDGITFLKPVQDRLPCFAGITITICCQYSGKLV